MVNHGVANPSGRKDFPMLLRPLRLLLKGLPRPGLDEPCIFIKKKGPVYFPLPFKSGPPLPVGIGAPEDMALRGLVHQKLLQKPRLIQFNHVVGYIDNQWRHLQ
ncbi:MAG: hypothetical protein LKE16_08090 [Dialister sp.]|nr:hypothetical protein [Dialister sp.]